MSQRTQPAHGVYRLTPATKYHRQPYDVGVGATGCGYVAWGDQSPWDSATQQFIRTDAEGWKFGWVCFGDGTYIHFAINPTPYNTPALIVLDAGTCEVV
jgi:hypothetical protein